LLVKELSTAKNTDEDTVLAEIESFFRSLVPSPSENGENPEDDTTAGN
jgi:hypothetical protein